MDTFSALKADAIEFRQNSYEIIIIPDSELQFFEDDEGRKAWVFSKNQYIKTYLIKNLSNFIHNGIKKIPPPWAAVIKGINNEGTIIYTDIYGLQHLYLRIIDKKVYVGTNLIEIASIDDVHINNTAVFELMSRGNPQQERTIFKEIKSLFGAQKIKIGNKITKESYWKFKEPDPLNENDIIDLFSKTLSKVIQNRYSEKTVLELTAGRDSMLMLSAFLKEKLPIKTWTHGFSDSFDLLGAQARAKHFGISHQSIYLEPLLNLKPQDYYLLFDEFLTRSQGMANVLEYWVLPWILKQVNASKSITGVGGEVFRGFYYEWMGKRFLPKRMGRYFLIHGKLRQHMPYTPDYLNNEIKDVSYKLLEDELASIASYSSNFWQSLDIYYLRHRMHHFAGTTFSTVRHWCEPELPLFDPELIELLPLIPIKLRSNYNGINDAVTHKFLNELKLSEKKNEFAVTTMSRGIKLAKRLKQLHGTWITSKNQLFAWKILKVPEIRDMLDIGKMKTAHLYNPIKFGNTIKSIYRNEKEIPLPIGASLTIEALCRKIKSNVIE